jgi:hypothetical protein
VVFIGNVPAYADSKTLRRAIGCIAKHAVTSGESVSVVVAVFVAEDWFGLACHFVVIYEKLRAIDWYDPSVLFAKSLMTLNCFL